MPRAGRTWAIGFNERIHKKQVLPYIGSSQNYLYPCISKKPNFYPTNVFGILVFRGSFLNVMKSKKDTFLLNHLATKISSGIIQKVHLLPIMFTQDSLPNHHQIYTLTIILRHQLHNQTQISGDFVLAQPFATLKNAIIMK